MDQIGCCKSNSEVNGGHYLADESHTDPTLRATLRRRSRSRKKNMPKTERTMDRTVGIARCEYCVNGVSVWSVMSESERVRTSYMAASILTGSNQRLLQPRNRGKNTSESHRRSETPEMCLWPTWTWDVVYACLG